MKESKLNYRALEGYSREFASIFCNRWYKENDKINGDQILQLTPVNQVNLFVIKNLFDTWKREISEMRSPYFDYSSKEVKKAMKDLGNILSRNISIGREELLKLLETSTYDTMLIILSPYDYFVKEMNNPLRSRVKLKYLNQIRKFVKINSHLLDAYISRFEEEGNKELFNDDAFRLLNEVFRDIKDTPDDVEKNVSVFNEVIPFDLDRIYTEEAIQEPETDEEASPTLNDQFSSEQSTLNEQLTGDPSSTLADTLQQQKFDSLKTYLTVNQRFMFVNSLFAGNSDEFNQAVDKIDAFQSYEEAIRYVDSDLSARDSWDNDSQAVMEFRELLSRKTFG